MELIRELESALGAHYRVERELGSGGMAVVFLALDLKHGRRVAIKVLRPELSAALGGDRFIREIAIAATLQHPHILPLFDSGQAGHLLYYVMPFVEGESLRQRLAREPQLPLETALQITREVGSALQYAHDHGVVHRDIKPENIMLSAGQAVVADFGIARALDVAGGDQLTATGMVVGTAAYMSPEQVGGVLDGRADQYSLACTCFEMLVGHPPFTGPDFHTILARHSLDPVPALRASRQAVPPVVEAAVMRAMAKLPADRFPSMGQFLEAIAPSGLAALPPNAQIQPPTRLVTLLANRASVAVLGGALLLSAVGWWLVAGRPKAAAAPGAAAVSAVAVLPFQDLTSGPDSSFLGDGVTAGLIADLAEIGSLKVISRSSGAMAQGKALSLAALATDLGVDAVVSGSVRRVGDSVEVAVRFLRAPDSTLLFSRDYRGRLGALPDLQREITIALTGSISAKLKGAERQRLGIRREVDQRAYEAFLRGRFHLDRGDMELARSQFELAGRIAPDWAPPHVGMANYYTALPFSSDISPAEVLPKARAALARALELDETLPEAHAANGYIRAYYDWDWRAAEQEFRRAIELRPSDADAYFSYSRFLASRRRIDEAIAQLGRAVELDPLSLPLQANRALLDYFAGRYDEASSRLQQILQSDSTDLLAKWGLALVAEQQGKPDEALAILVPITGTSLNRKASLGHAYAMAGKPAQARRVLDDLKGQSAKRYVPSYFLALVYTGLGQREEALRALERAYEERSSVLAYLLIDPRLAPLRDDPRFRALARRLDGE